MFYKPTQLPGFLYGLSFPTLQFLKTFQILQNLANALNFRKISPVSPLYGGGPKFDIRAKRDPRLNQYIKYGKFCIYTELSKPDNPYISHTSCELIYVFEVGRVGLHSGDKSLPLVPCGKINDPCAVSTILYSPYH